MENNKQHKLKSLLHNEIINHKLNLGKPGVQPMFPTRKGFQCKQLVRPPLLFLQQLKSRGQVRPPLISKRNVSQADFHDGKPPIKRSTTSKNSSVSGVQPMRTFQLNTATQRRANAVSARAQRNRYKVARNAARPVVVAAMSATPVVAPVGEGGGANPFAKFVASGIRAAVLPVASNEEVVPVTHIKTTVPIAIPTVAAGNISLPSGSKLSAVSSSAASSLVAMRERTEDEADNAAELRLHSVLPPTRGRPITKANGEPGQVGFNGTAGDPDTVHQSITMLSNNTDSARKLAKGELLSLTGRRLFQRSVSRGSNGKHRSIGVVCACEDFIDPKFTKDCNHATDADRAECTACTRSWKAIQSHIKRAHKLQKWNKSKK